MSNCEKLFDCCDCGGKDCGCGYCWACKACENCYEGNEENCLNTKYNE